MTQHTSRASGESAVDKKARNDSVSRQPPHWAVRVRQHAHRILPHSSPMGLLFALFGLWTALTPSLVPRTWWMLAVSVSLSTLLFYGIGSLIGTMARWFADAIVLLSLIHI